MRRRRGLAKPLSFGLRCLWLSTTYLVEVRPSKYTVVGYKPTTAKDDATRTDDAQSCCAVAKLRKPDAPASREARSFNYAVIQL